MKRLFVALLLCLLPSLAQAASCTSYPFTLQNNTTADATQVMANFNTVRNCVVNNAAGSGVNTDITALLGLTTPIVPASGGTPVFIGGTSTGAANAQVVSSTTPTGFSLVSGYRVTFTAGFDNTAAMTLNVNASGATAVNRLGPAGVEALTGGEVRAGNVVEAIYNGSVLVLLTTEPANFNTSTSLASGTTTDLGTIGSHNVAIQGTTTITAFGSSATTTAPIYLIKFAGSLTLTYNASSLIIPGQGNITTSANDTAVVEYLGSGNWQVLSYTRASGASIVASSPLCGAIGYRAANNAGTPNTNYDMSATTAVMATTGGVTITVSSVAVTVNATTTGANGLDTGALANGTWYNAFLINNGTTTAGLLSTSATAPVMPSGYTYKCRMGAITTASGTSLFKRILQVGNKSQYQVTAATNTAGLPDLGSVTSANYQPLSVSTAVPPTATEIGVFAYNNSSAAAVFVAPNANYSTTISSTNPPFMAMGGATGAQGTTNGWMVLESTNIYATSSSGANTVNVAAQGWKDAVNAN